MSGHSSHPDYLGHHYDTPEQQFDSGSLGMWLFLATEVLLFAGLFCAYAIYRSHHPEIFLYAHQYLDKNMGALNTAVLIFSSFTMAMAVRMAQLGKNNHVVTLLTITLLCGFGFLGVKKVEYEAKWKHGLLWGKKFHPEEHSAGAHGTEALHDAGMTTAAGGAGASHDTGASHDVAAVPAAVPAGATDHGAAPATGGSTAAPTGINPANADPMAVRSNIAPPPAGPAGLAENAFEPKQKVNSHATPKERPSNVHIFFGIYFLMTGLHGVHVIAGMSAIAWVLWRTMKGHFSAQYSTPVHLVGLYWHLVDLVWIYLFPLLYLVG